MAPTLLGLATLILRMWQRALHIGGCTEHRIRLRLLFFKLLEANFRPRASPCRLQESMNISLFSDQLFEDNFRFTKADFLKLHAALRMPPIIKCKDRNSANSIRALVLVLGRMAYPGRFVLHSRLVNRSISGASSIFNTTIRWLCQRWHHLLRLGQRLTPERLDRFVAVMRRSPHNVPFRGVFGYIDGTLRPYCRPVVEQQRVYNGWKRVHGLKFQAVATPDGLIQDLAGPFVGTRHDARMFRECTLDADLRALPQSETGGTFCLYGDSAYTQTTRLFKPYVLPSNPDEKSMNVTMSRSRIRVEWCFQRVLRDWAFIDFKKNQKMLLQPVALYYIVGVLLTNAKTCLHGNSTSKHFDLEPPPLDEYFV
jgi:hypothetical protein